MSKKTNDNNLGWYGWKLERPTKREKTIMMKKCGTKCFLGPYKNKSFPICKKGAYAAFIRARQWGKKPSTYKGKSLPKYSMSTYRRIQTHAKKILNRHGFSKVGKRKTMRRKK